MLRDVEEIISKPTWRVGLCFTERSLANVGWWNERGREEEEDGT